jgi:hypothetical protein
MDRILDRMPIQQVGIPDMVDIDAVRGKLFALGVFLRPANVTR